MSFIADVRQKKMTNKHPCNFGDRFIASKGQPLEYGGKTIVMIDRFPCTLHEELIVTIESTTSNYPQGVGISEDVEVFGEQNKRAVVFEFISLPPDERATRKSQLPFTFTVKSRNKKGFLAFYNMSQLNGIQEWWHGGCAMVVEEIANGRRYHCNDFELDDDFNDIVFTVKRKEGAAEPSPGPYGSPVAGSPSGQA